MNTDYYARAIGREFEFTDTIDGIHRETLGECGNQFELILLDLVNSNNSSCSQPIKLRRELSSFNVHLRELNRLIGNGHIDIGTDIENLNGNEVSLQINKVLTINSVDSSIIGHGDNKFEQTSGVDADGGRALDVVVFNLEGALCIIVIALIDSAVGYVGGIDAILLAMLRVEELGEILSESWLRSMASSGTTMEPEHVCSPSV